MKNKAISFLLCSTLSFTACGVSPQPAPAPPPVHAPEENIVLRVYAQYSDDDTKIPWDYMISELAKEMPGVTLELDIEAQDDNAKIKTMAAIGKLPDIFRAQGSLIQTLKESDNILELDDYVISTGFKDRMIDSAMNCLYDTDGHVYAFPYAGNEYELLYYNKALFEQYGIKVPTTYEELETAITVFRENNIIPLAIWAKEKWPPVALFDMIASRFDNAGITKLDNGYAKASDEAYKKAAEQMARLVDMGLLPDGCTSMAYDQSAELFYSGKAAMFMNGQWEIPQATERLGDKVDWMYYPSYDAESYEASKYVFSGSGGLNGFAVSPYSEHKDLAAEVAAFMALKYAECKFAKRGSAMVATKVDLPVEKEYDPMMVKLLADVPKLKGTAFTWYLTNPRFGAAIEDAAQALCLPNASVDEFVKNVDRSLQ